ncbi:MAG: hypothetical protein A2486_11430 [Burkholderiales bacterium RIFOXYC12_FULL_65_23]|nr:MAG: hypothetical protein A2486_11430 [Burkholderiales bacterium RIFOXYC12_FULL_65_23]
MTAAPRHRLSNTPTLHVQAPADIAWTKKEPHEGAWKALRLVAREVSDGDESRLQIYYKSF